MASQQLSRATRVQMVHVLGRPQEVAALAGFREFDEATGKVRSVDVDDVSVGENHVGCRLTTGDLYVWGRVRCFSCCGMITVGSHTMVDACRTTGANLALDRRCESCIPLRGECPFSCVHAGWAQVNQSKPVKLTGPDGVLAGSFDTLGRVVHPSDPWRVVCGGDSTAVYRNASVWVCGVPNCASK
jgi:hypothetical protein